MTNSSSAPIPCDIPSRFALRVAHIDEVPALSAFHRWSILRSKDDPVGVTLHTRYTIDPKKNNRLNLLLIARYHTLRSQLIRPLIDYAIQASFDVDDLSTLTSEKNGELSLATGLLSLTLSVGIGALRGMIALGVRNTFLAQYPLPVFNIADLLAKVSYPDAEMTEARRIATIRLADI